MNIDQLIEKISNKINLNIEETQFVFRFIMSGDLSEEKIASILIKLADKGEASDEITGGASVLRERNL